MRFEIACKGFEYRDRGIQCGRLNETGITSGHVEGWVACASCSGGTWVGSDWRGCDSGGAEGACVASDRRGHRVGETRRGARATSAGFWVALPLRECERCCQRPWIRGRTIRQFSEDRQFYCCQLACVRRWRLAR